MPSPGRCERAQGLDASVTRIEHRRRSLLGCLPEERQASRRAAEGLRRWQEGEGQEAPHPGRRRRARGGGQGPQRQGLRPGRHQVPARAGPLATTAAFVSMGGRGLPRKRQGVDVGEARRGGRGREPFPKAAPGESLADLGQGVAQGRARDGPWQAAQASGFREPPRRWVAERTLAWIGRNRRMSKDRSGRARRERRSSTWR